jgi:hypothetical protein
MRIAIGGRLPELPLSVRLVEIADLDQEISPKLNLREYAGLCWIFGKLGMSNREELVHIPSGRGENYNAATFRRRLWLPMMQKQTSLAQSWPGPGP